MGEWSASQFGEEGKKQNSANKVEERKSRWNLARLDNRAKPFFGVVEAALKVHVAFIYGE